MEFHANVLALDIYLANAIEDGSIDLEFIKPIGRCGGGAKKKIQLKATYPVSNHTYVENWQGNDKLSGAQLAEKYLLDQNDDCEFAQVNRKDIYKWSKNFPNVATGRPPSTKKQEVILKFMQDNGYEANPDSELGKEGERFVEYLK